MFLIHKLLIAIFINKCSEFLLRDRQRFSLINDELFDIIISKLLHFISFKKKVVRVYINYEMI